MSTARPLEFVERRKRGGQLAKITSKPRKNAPLRVRLRWTRVTRRLRRWDLAKILHVSANTIGEWEHGEWTPGSSKPLGRPIPPLWVPILEEWIRTNEPPAAELIEAARADRAFQMRGLKNPKYPLVQNRPGWQFRLRRAGILKGSGLSLGAIAVRLREDERALRRAQRDFPDAWHAAVQRGADRAARRNALPIVEVANCNITNPQTVRDVFCLYKNHLAKRLHAGRLSNGHFKEASRLLGRFEAVFGDQKIEDCKRHDLARWRELNPAWRSYWSIKHGLGVIKQAFAWVAHEELIQRDPYRNVEYPEGNDGRRPDVTRDQLAAVIRHSPRPLRRILFFLQRCGCRPKEGRHLAWSHCDLEAGSVRQTTHKTMKQRLDGAPRLFALEPAVLRLLRNMHRKRQRGSAHVFYNTFGTLWTQHELGHAFRRSIQYAVRDPRYRHIKSWDDKLSPYSIRHLYITEAIRSGLSGEAIAAQVGWASTAMLRRYNHAPQQVDYLREIAVKAIQRNRGGRGAA